MNYSEYEGLKLGFRHSSDSQDKMEAIKKNTNLLE